MKSKIRQYLDDRRSKRFELIQALQEKQTRELQRFDNKTYCHMMNLKEELNSTKVIKRIEASYGSEFSVEGITFVVRNNGLSYCLWIKHNTKYIELRKVQHTAFGAYVVPPKFNVKITEGDIYKAWAEIGYPE